MCSAAVQYTGTRATELSIQAMRLNGEKKKKLLLEAIKMRFEEREGWLAIRTPEFPQGDLLGSGKACIALGALYYALGILEKATYWWKHSLKELPEDAVMEREAVRNNLEGVKITRCHNELAKRYGPNWKELGRTESSDDDKESKKDTLGDNEDYLSQNAAFESQLASNLAALRKLQAKSSAGAASNAPAHASPASASPVIPPAASAKPIDYSKWDNFVDSDDEDVKTA
jgi:hypothetical protein